MQPNGITPLVVPEDAFRAFLTHEAVGKGLQVRRQNFALPALVLGAFRFWLGFMEERGNLYLFANTLPGDQRQEDVGPRVNPQAPQNAMAGLVQFRAKQGGRTGPMPAEKAVFDEPGGCPAGSSQCRQEQGVAPYQETEAKASDCAGVVTPAPQNAANQGRAELGSGGKREQSEGGEAVIGPGHPVEAIGGQ